MTGNMQCYGYVTNGETPLTFAVGSGSIMPR